MLLDVSLIFICYSFFSYNFINDDRIQDRCISTTSFYFILLFLYVALMIDIFLQSKIIALFRRHGAVEVVITPLLSPYVKNAKNNAVRLMSHSGSVVVLPHDLRVPFIKHAALSGINVIRRYSVGRVYREKKIQSNTSKSEFKGPNYNVSFGALDKIPMSVRRRCENVIT